ncbi:MAG TPA: methyltransferase [Actinomycetota bacterium]|nr:methyltransferase [Actinomycetota bacterium]
MAALRELLLSEQYDEQTIALRLRLNDRLTVRAADLPVVVRRLKAGDRLDVLLKLFFLGFPVHRTEVEASFAGDEISYLIEIGLLGSAGSELQPKLRIVPAFGMLFAHDNHRLDNLQVDSVLGWTSSARTLASMTVRRPVESVLDLGTGSGLQALLASRHADRVVALDLNPRALWLTELNCMLNGVDNVETRQGNMYEPTRGETYDLVVTNPPFVISPSEEYLFRDAGFEADELSRTAVEGAAGVLKDGGFAHVMCNWVSVPDEPWDAPVRRWVEGTGCDALLLRYDTLDPLAYAAAWNEHLASDSQRFSRTLDRWLDYYGDHGIESISLGAVNLRRRESGEAWVTAMDLLRGPAGSSSDHLLRIFDAQDQLQRSGGGRSLLDQAFAPIEGHRLEQILLYRDGGYAAQDAVILLDDGIGLTNRVEPQSLHVLLRMDGRTPLGRLIAEAADETGMDAEILAASAVPCVQSLLGMGLVNRTLDIDPSAG